VTPICPQLAGTTSTDPSYQAGYNEGYNSAEYSDEEEEDVHGGSLAGGWAACEVLALLASYVTPVFLHLGDL
jgi:hypothetical protein